MTDTTDLPIPGPRTINEVNNIVCISDLHSGCKLALCPREGVRLDDGGLYTPSDQQLLLNGMWEEFHNDWIPFATRGERYSIVVNGDAIEGDHHKASTPISPNPVDQCRIFHALMEPVVERAKGGLYMVRGTETHVGISARHEELLAEKLGAIPNDQGQHSHWDLWKQIGADKLIHFLHHIGVTGSSAYEATAVGKELVEEYVEAARWRLQPPDVIVRSHRHRNYQIVVPVGTVNPETGETITGEAIAIVTPGWQLKTPHVYKIPGGRISQPQFGGICVRVSDDGVLYAASKVWTVQRSRTH